jgi:hypothetical protein
VGGVTAIICHVFGVIPQVVAHFCAFFSAVKLNISAEKKSIELDLALNSDKNVTK